MRLTAKFSEEIRCNESKQKQERTMSTFTARATPASTSLDPTKHVNYNLGMVLGVDDFTQEFAYLSGHDQWLARDLIGYGTVSGLRVFTEADAKGPRVVVEPGVALNPHGQLIRVPTAQCAYLNDWLKLEATRTRLLARVVSPPTTIRVYVVLCYRECPTDKVPIPGEPCRSEDDVMLPSRLMDDFRLELMLDPPGQREEDAVRDFVDWLRQVTISDAVPGVSLEDFLQALRVAAHIVTSPPSSGSAPLTDYMFDSPPGSLVINSDDVCQYLDAAFRLWVTELRPRWRPDFFAGENDSSAKTEGCLLLAEVDVPAIIPAGGTDWQVQNGLPIDVEEDRRPIVVHLRMVQEMLLCGRRERAPSGGGGGGGGPLTLGGDVIGVSTNTRAVKLQGVAVDTAAPTENQVLTFRAGRWRPAAVAVASPTVAGDVTGNIGDTTVARIRNIPVVGTPGDGQVLTFRNNQWQAEVPSAGGAVDIVDHPPGLPKYSIVAAGIVKCDGTSRAPVYNQLTATATNASQVTVRFKGDKVPDGSTFQYVVKAMPVRDDAVGLVWVSFGAFLRTGGFQLRVERLNPTNPAQFTLARDELARLELLIEVSRFEAGT
jgi:hypothetical protein